MTGRYATCEHWTIRRLCDLCNTPEDLELDRLREKVACLTRERDEARAHYTAERERANEWLAQLHDAYRHGGPVTDDVLALADALGLREGKHTTSSVATHALAEIKRLRAAKEAP